MWIISLWGLRKVLVSSLKQQQLWLCAQRDPLDPARLCQSPSARAGNAVRAGRAQHRHRETRAGAGKGFAIIPHPPPDPLSLEGMCLAVAGRCRINGIADQSICTAQARAMELQVIINQWIRISKFWIKDKAWFRSSISPHSAVFHLKLIGSDF